MDLFTAQVVRKEASLDELMAGSIASIKQLFDHVPGVNYFGRSTSIILAGGSEA